MTKTKPAHKRPSSPVAFTSLAAVRGGTDVRYGTTTTTTRSGGDDDDSGPIIIIGRDGP